MENTLLAQNQKLRRQLRAAITQKIEIATASLDMAKYDQSVLKTNQAIATWNSQMRALNQADAADRRRRDRARP